MIGDLDEVSLAYLIDPTFQLVNTAGKPLTDGWIEVYIHGTRNKYYCAKDFDGTLHEFKIPLDSLGSNIVLASPAHAYDVYVYNKFGSLVMSRYNVVPATGDGAVIKEVVNITSKDGTVGVTTSNKTDFDLSIKDTVDRVEANTTEIGQIKDNVAGIESSLTNKKDKQSANTFTGSATKTVKTITQNANGEMHVEFEDINLPPEVPNVEITSEDNSVQVTETTDVQTKTKTFDISVNTDIVATNKDVSDLESLINHKLDSKEDVSNKIQVVNDSSTTEYPSSKAVANFVNSSVSTNTATFLGNFSLEDLGLTYPATEVQIATALNSHTWPTGYPTNNDYVYVEIRNPQSSIYDKVQRYKYRAGVASWGYEYTLNNSSFTAEELAAIDSGVTSHDVTNLRADHTTLGTHVDNTSNPHKVTKSQVGLGNVDNTRDADKPVSTAQQNALNKKLDKTGDASNTTASFTKNSGDTSSVTSGSKLSAIFTAISSFFASLKALAFKDKVSDSDINGTISDSHIASASTWNGKADKVSGAANGNLAALDSNGNLTDSGKKASDLELVTNKVSSWQDTPDNTHFPSEKLVKDALDGKANTNNFVSVRGAQGFMLKCPKDLRLYDGYFVNILNGYGGRSYINITFAIRKEADGSLQVDRYNTDVSSNSYPGGKNFSVYYGTYPSDPNTTVILIVPTYSISGIVNLSSRTSQILWTVLYDIPDTTGLSSITPIEHNNVFGANKGSASVPVYVDANGAATPCTDDFVHDGDLESVLNTVEGNINGKADKANITGDTKCKVTYNSQGIVTAGDNLSSSDIPNLDASKITSGTFSDSRIASSYNWNAKYTKPSTGIPKGDLDSAVQTSLDKADTALQSHQDISGKKDKQNPYSVSGSSTKTVKRISQNANGELNVEFEDIDLPQNLVQDANYVHTDNNFTTSEKTKLAGIQAGAEQNVQSDWNQTDSSADDYIKNKPSIPTKDSDLTNDRYVRFDANNQGLTDAQKSNARTNIGAGTSNLELGESAFTAAYGNHRHGRLQNNGSLGDENWSVSSGDRIVIAKAEYNGKLGYLVPSAIIFNSNEDSKALTQSAEWKEFLPPNGDGSSVSVTPDGTSTGYDIGIGTTLKVLAQKFKNLVNALKALAFKDKVTDSDISGTISDSHIASASTWSGKQSALATQTAYSARGSATKVPQITTNSLGQVTGISEVTISGVTPSSHASTEITYGVGTTANYGHVKLLSGDLNGKSYTDGVAAASAHTHGQYLTSHQSITTGSRNGSIAVSGRDVDVKGLGRLAYKSAIGTGDVSSGTYSIDISGKSARATSAYRPLPFYTYVGEITNSTARHWQILKRTLSNSGDSINAVITVFIRSGKDTFLAYNVSFLIYRSGNSFVGKVFKTNIGNGDNSMSVTFNLIKTPDSNEVSVIASIAASTSSSLYISGYATATLVEWANFVTENNTGSTIADIVGTGYSNIASA